MILQGAALALMAVATGFLPWAIGASLLGGAVADAVDLRAAVWVVAALSVASGLVVAVRTTPRA